MPFGPNGEFASFDECVSKNGDKDDPAAYCAAVKSKTESRRVLLKEHVTFTAPITLQEHGGTGRAFVIGGTAIEETVSRNGIRYVAKELEKSAHTLQGRKIITDHEAKVRNIVGVIDESKFDSQSNSVKYRGKVMDPQMQEMIRDGRITNVSIGASVDELVEETLNGETIREARGIVFDELSFVVVPGVDAATVQHKLENAFVSAICEKFELNQVKPMPNEKLKEELPAGNDAGKMKAMEEEIALLKKENEELKSKLANKEVAKPPVAAEKSAEALALEEVNKKLAMLEARMSPPKVEPAGKAVVGEAAKDELRNFKVTGKNGKSFEPRVDARGNFVKD